MNSAPSSMKSAATETSVEIRNIAECTALRAITVRSAAMSAESANTQKKTLSQPERIINQMMNAECGMRNEEMLAAFNSSFIIPHSSFPFLRLKLARLAPLLKHLAVPDEACARVCRKLELLREFEAGRRASLLAERAEHAARGVEDELVEDFLLDRKSTRLNSSHR